MIEDERSHVIETLADLKKSDTEKIRKAASGALWNLRDELRNSTDKTHQEIGMYLVKKQNIATIGPPVKRHSTLREMYAV